MLGALPATRPARARRARSRREPTRRRAGPKPRGEAEAPRPKAAKPRRRPRDAARRPRREARRPAARRDPRRRAATARAPSARLAQARRAAPPSRRRPAPARSRRRRAARSSSRPSCRRPASSRRIGATVGGQLAQARRRQAAPKPLTHAAAPSRSCARWVYCRAAESPARSSPANGGPTGTHRVPGANRPADAAVALPFAVASPTAHLAGARGTKHRRCVCARPRARAPARPSPAARPARRGAAAPSTGGAAAPGRSPRPPPARCRSRRKPAALLGASRKLHAARVPAGDAGRTVTVERLTSSRARWTPIARGDRRATTAPTSPAGSPTARRRAAHPRARVEAPPTATTAAAAPELDDHRLHAPPRPPGTAPASTATRPPAARSCARRLLGVAHRKLPCGTPVSPLQGPHGHRPGRRPRPVRQRRDWDLTAATAAAARLHGHGARRRPGRRARADAQARLEVADHPHGQRLERAGGRLRAQRAGPPAAPRSGPRPPAPARGAIAGARAARLPHVAGPASRTSRRPGRARSRGGSATGRLPGRQADGEPRRVDDDRPLVPDRRRPSAIGTSTGRARRVARPPSKSAKTTADVGRLRHPLVAVLDPAVVADALERARARSAGWRWPASRPRSRATARRASACAAAATRPSCGHRRRRSTGGR